VDPDFAMDHIPHAAVDGNAAPAALDNCTS
jgi:hypothetical protein